MHNFNRIIRQIGLPAMLVGLLGVGLAACGAAPTATPAPQPTGTAGPAISDPTATPVHSPTTALQPTPTNTTTMAADPAATTVAMTEDPAPTEAGMEGEVQEVQLTIQEWKITPATVEIKPGPVKFIVTNIGEFSHNITIVGGSGVVGATPTFAANESPQEIYIEEMQAGNYDMMCSLPGHASLGQRGTIIVK